VSGPTTGPGMQPSATTLPIAAPIATLSGLAALTTAEPAHTQILAREVRWVDVSTKTTMPALGHIMQSKGDDVVVDTVTSDKVVKQIIAAADRLKLMSLGRIGMLDFNKHMLRLAVCKNLDNLFEAIYSKSI
jgi:hypothetical protein